MLKSFLKRFLKRVEEEEEEEEVECLVSTISNSIKQSYSTWEKTEFPRTGICFNRAHNIDEMVKVIIYSANVPGRYFGEIIITEVIFSINNESCKKIMSSWDEMTNEITREKKVKILRKLGCLGESV
jgi:hypothetical protein